MSRVKKPISERKIPFHCYLTPELLMDLDALSDQERRPKAELVREAIEQYVVERKKETKSQRKH